MSWKTEVLVEGKWASNALRFATEQEALDAGVELLSRWFVPTDHRAVECGDPVNAEQRDPRSRAVHLRMGVTS